MAMTPHVFASADAIDVIEIPACLLSFIQRKLATAKIECLDADVRAALAQYDLMRKNISDSQLRVSLNILHINENLIQEMDLATHEPLTIGCKGPK